MMRSFTRFKSAVPLRLGKVNRDYTEVVVDGNAVSFNNVFLRDADASAQSVDPLSRQKLFNTSDILLLEASNVRIEGEALKVDWTDGTATVSASYHHLFLRKHATLRDALRDKCFREEQLIWDRDTLDPGRLQMSHARYATAAGFAQTVSNLNAVGLSFINDIARPTAHERATEANASSWPVYDIAMQFGYVKKTFYGTLFDVKNQKADAKNIAYTNVYLPLHMDLCYYESPPGLQFLHAIDNSTLGGANVFCDSFKAAQWVRQRDPDAYAALQLYPLVFQYDNNGEYYYYSRPLVEEDALTGAIRAVNYSPPFQGPFEVGVTEGEDRLFRRFLRGYKLFEQAVNDPQNTYEVKLPEGTCVVFDNRRVLHLRLEFSDANGGDRWLMGCYVDGDSFRSRLRTTKRDT